MTKHHPEPSQAAPPESTREAVDRVRAARVAEDRRARRQDKQEDRAILRAQQHAERPMLETLVAAIRNGDIYRSIERYAAEEMEWRRERGK